MLEVHDQEKRKTLQDLGMTREIDEHSAVMEDHVLRNQFRQKYGEGIVHIDEIREVCVKYKLRFLPSSYYADKVDSQLAGVVKHYCTKHNISASALNFKVLAVAKSFKLEKVTGQTWMAALADSLKDPILFHDIGNGYYRIVHAWGSDFTFLRRLKAYPYQSKTTMAITASLVYFAIIASGAILLDLMERVPNDLNDEKVREEYLKNHVEWFLKNHNGAKDVFEKEVEIKYGKTKNGKSKSHEIETIRRRQLW